jgi:pantoate--beta-alanine ligase
MITLNSVSTLREALANYKRDGKKVAFVPTMGNLHEGHLSLVDAAKQRADVVVASIFVNPMQFGANEDLDAYPRTLEADSNSLIDHGCDILFAPSVEEVYPCGLAAETRVEVPELGAFHCGASREGHFVGVSTVVAKLFNMVQPDIAIFGQKDFQQLAIIRKMARDLCMPIEIVGIATSREDSGLARSSRNGYLSAEQKQQATAIYASISDCVQAIKDGRRDFAALESEAKIKLQEAGFKPDYFNIAHPDTLKPATKTDTGFVILAAAFLGTTRLIDNITVSL